MLSEKHVDHVAVPGRPGTVFVVAHPKVALALLETLLDGPAHTEGGAHLRERHVGWGVGKGIADLPIFVASDDQPKFIALGQPIVGTGDAQARHFGNDRSLRSLGQNDALPADASALGKSRDLDRTRRREDAWTLGARTASVVGRNTNAGPAKKDLGRGPRLGQVVHPGGQVSKKRGIRAKGGITTDPSRGKLSLAEHAVYQLAGNLWLGGETQVLRHQVVLAPLAVLFIEP